MVIDKWKKLQFRKYNNIIRVRPNGNIFDIMDKSDANYIYHGVER